MTRVRTEATIAAPAAAVFDMMTAIERFPEVSDDVVRVEFLTEQRIGVGTRFRETRRMPNGDEGQFELEVTELEPGRRARFVTDSHGTVWDTVYTFEESSDGTHVTMTMDARAHALMPRLLNPFMRGFFRKGMAKYLATVKAKCESASRARA